MSHNFIFKSTKTYCHNLGLSVCFRQWRAKDSHCRFLHGYALQVKLVFEACDLDERMWVVDFGGLKPVKKFLEDKFDHKLIVAGDDPELDRFLALDKTVAEVLVFRHVGCEAFAKEIYNFVDSYLLTSYKSAPDRVVLRSVEVREHGGNSAIYERVEMDINKMRFR